MFWPQAVEQSQSYGAVHRSSEALMLVLGRPFIALRGRGGQMKGGKERREREGWREGESERERVREMGKTQ